MDVQLLHISKQFEEKIVLNNLSLTFLEGTVNCLMGASGSGKTTIINLIMGIQRPDKGEILGCRNRRIGAVFQEERLIEHWDAVRNIRLVCDNNVTTEQVEQELQKLGIEDVKNKPVRNFSGGMRRRVALVRAILAPSDILIMDEPFKGLDEELKKQVIEYVKKNVAGKTVIIVTHEKEEAQLLAANIVTL